MYIYIYTCSNTGLPLNDGHLPSTSNYLSRWLTSYPLFFSSAAPPLRALWTPHCCRGHGHPVPWWRVSSKRVRGMAQEEPLVSRPQKDAPYMVEQICLSWCPWPFIVKKKHGSFPTFITFACSYISMQHACPHVFELLQHYWQKTNKAVSGILQHALHKRLRVATAILGSFVAIYAHWRMDSI